MIIKWICETGFASCEHEGEVEVDDDATDDATDDEIDEIIREEVFNVISWGWEKAGEEP